MANGILLRRVVRWPGFAITDTNLRGSGGLATRAAVVIHERRFFRQPSPKYFLKTRVTNSSTDVDFNEQLHGPLRGLARCGKGVRIRARRLVVEGEVELGDGVTLAGDEIRLGLGTRVHNNCDLRAAHLDIGMRCDIGVSSKILTAEQFTLGAAGRIEELAKITCRSFQAGKLFFVGDDFVVGAGGTMESTATVRLGDRIALGSHCVLNANVPIVMEDQVGSGDYVTLWTSGYHFGHSILDGYSPAYAPIHVERNVWLAYHVTVLPGVRIGHDTIVASGSVVTKDLPANVLAAGAPAQVRRQLEGRAQTEAELLPVVEKLLETWARELQWKGLTVFPRSEQAAGSRWELAFADGRRGALWLLKAGGSPPPPSEGEVRVMVSVEDRPDLQLGAQAALFELRSRNYRGESFDLGEDLRDFLRRRTVPCGDDRLFSSIVPTAFERLRRML